MRAQQDNPHEPHLPIKARSQSITDRESETSLSEAARSIDLFRLKKPMMPDARCVFGLLNHSYTCVCGLACTELVVLGD